MANIRYEDKNFSFIHNTTERPMLDSFHMHVHNEYEIIYVVSGDCSYVLEDKIFKLKKNNLIVISPGKYHFLQIDGSSTTYERYNILIDPLTQTANNIDSLENFELLDCTNDSLITDIFKRLDYYYNELNSDQFADILGSIMKELVYCINIHKSNLQHVDAHTQNAIVTKILAYIEQHLTTLSGIKEVAEANYVSDAYLFRLFKKHLKISPHKYVNDKRLILAQKMIRLGTRPTVAYEKCGFSGYTTFFKSYVKYFGHAPSADFTNTK